ncbi:MAG: glucose-6-phosphate isomerase [bacterium]
MGESNLTIDYSHMMADAIGEENGISIEDFKGSMGRACTAADAVRAAAEAGRLGFCKLPFDRALVNEITSLSNAITPEIDNFVVLGIGGSALGNIALHTALNHPYYNLLSRKQRGDRPRIFVLDNVDPEFVAGAMDLLDLERTAINVITKSGSTAETMSQCLLFISAMEKKIGKKRMRARVIATTDPRKGALRELALKEGYRLLPIPEDVGGRFSVLSAVGLLSAAVSGIDVGELLEGARMMHKVSTVSDASSNPALALALVHYLAYEKGGKPIAVMMPYCNALLGVADWFRQLWAESLGKRVDRAGAVVNVGQTPVKALGATDQHSQIQLYMEGPCDKMVTFMGVGEYRCDVTIPPPHASDDAFDYLSGRTMNDLICAERKATALALARNGRPNMSIEISRVTPRTVGMLLYMFEMQTALAAELLDIDAFDQPGVEHGKKLTYAMMGRSGCENLRKEIERMEGQGRSGYAVEV